MKKLLISFMAFSFLLIPSLSFAQDEVAEEAESLIPTFWDLSWQAVKERVVLLMTVDEVKQVEKRIKYAQERMDLADLLSKNENISEVQSKINRMIKRSNSLMSKIEENKESWNENKEKIESITNKLSSYQIKREEIMDKIEKLIPDEAMQKFNELRTASLEIGKKLYDVFELDQLPEKAKENIIQTKNMLNKRSEQVNSYRDELSDLEKRVGEGDEDAEVQLKNLQQQRIEDLRERGGDLQDLKQLLKGLNVPIE